MLERIYSGNLPAGSVVNEATLALEFGVSRGPVREAVRRLQGIQLVSREPYLKARVVNLTARAAVELFEMRAALEGYACRLAAERMHEGETGLLLDDLERAHQSRLRGHSSIPAGKVFDFHERIVRGSGNQRIIDALCGDLYHLLRIYRRKSGAVPERKQAAFTEHWQIARAIHGRDGDLAESLMRSHIERASHHLLEEFER